MSGRVRWTGGGGNFGILMRREMLLEYAQEAVIWTSSLGIGLLIVKIGNGCKYLMYMYNGKLGDRIYQFLRRCCVLTEVYYFV